MWSLPCRRWPYGADIMCRGHERECDQGVKGVRNVRVNIAPCADCSFGLVQLDHAMLWKWQAHLARVDIRDELALALRRVGAFSEQNDSGLCRKEIGRMDINVCATHDTIFHCMCRHTIETQRLGFPTAWLGMGTTWKRILVEPVHGVDGRNRA